MNKAKAWKTRTCKNCNKRFLTIDKLIAHIADNHIANKPRQTIVNEASTMEYSYKQHIADLSACKNNELQTNSRYDCVL